MMSICQWLMVLSVVAAVTYVAWLKRCLVLRHTWSWKSRPHACGQRMGTIHLISCGRCRKAHIEYQGWWEPLPMVRVDGVTITKPSAGLASAIQRARGGPAPPMVQRGFA